MTVSIEEIKKWLAKNDKMRRPWQDTYIRCPVGEMKAVLAALEKAEEERDAALDRLKRAQENWEKLADTAAKNLARVELARDFYRRLSALQYRRIEKWKAVAEGSAVEYGQANKRAAEAVANLEKLEKKGEQP